MKHIASTATMMHKNGPGCTVWEYGAGEQLDIAIATITGRYPENGFVVNEVSEEAVYVISGTGNLATRDTRVSLQPGDAVFITANDPYYFEGEDLRITVSCTPPWSPDQHKELA